MSKAFDSIICIGQTPWEGDFQKAVVQLMGELSVRHQVLYVDYQYTLKDMALGLLGKRSIPVGAVLRLTPPFLKKTAHPGSAVSVWIPPLMLSVNWLPASLHDRLLRWNVARLVRSLRQVMQQQNLHHPLVINAFNPVFGLNMLGQLNESATIYYCFDEIKMARWMSRHGSRFEPVYMNRVDAVVTTSEALRQAKALQQPATYCVKNGVNFDLFNQAEALARQQPPPKRPVVGYLGTADNRVDLPLVTYCVSTMPDVLFRFVGEVHEPRLREQLGAYPNVEFVAPRQPASLPPLLAGMQAAMIPFVCNAHTYTIYPLKINEYLAAGLPVVATPFSILDEFVGIVALADTPEAFAQALRHALTDHSPARIAERVAMAKANSWAHRAEEFEAIIEQVMSA